MGLQDSKSLTLKNDQLDYLLSSEYKYKTWIMLEKTVAKAQAELGIIPKEAAQAIQDEVNYENFSTETYDTYLKKIGHGFYSFVDCFLLFCLQGFLQGLTYYCLFRSLFLLLIDM